MKARELAELLLQHPEDVVELAYEDCNEDIDTIELDEEYWTREDPWKIGIRRYEAYGKYYICLNYQGV